jgi:glucokinase
VITEVALAFDLGGTRLKSGVVEVGSGAVVFEAAPVDAAPTWADALRQVTAAARELRGDYPAARAVGMAMPGVLDGGCVRSLPGKLAGAEGTDADTWLRAELAVDGAATVVTNDAIAAGVGEAGAGPSRTLVITLGTGVGVCVIEGGRPLGSGAFGGGILGGQVPLGGALEDARFKDTAGRCGTIEAYCRADALTTRARLLGGEREWSDAKAVADAARSGDVLACDALDAYRGDIARAVVALALAHAPERVVIGGGVAGVGSPVFDGLEAAVNARLSFGLRVRVEAASLGSRAALAGLGVLLGAAG